MATRPFAALLLAASSAFAAFAAPAAVRAHGDDDGGKASKSLVKLVDIAVKDVDVVNGELVATAELTLDVVGRKLVRTVDLPIVTEASPGANGCDVLNLSLGPINLNVLGLLVDLDNCESGPITVDITADPAGGLLGELLCSIAGGVMAGDLQTVFDALEPSDQETVRVLLEFLLSESLGGSLMDCQMHHGGGDDHHSRAAKKPRQICQLLNLEVGAITLTLLGLTVETSDICLDVRAKRGQGNLLGNLLCGLTELLDQPGDRVGQIRKLTRRIRDAIIDLRELSL